MSDRAASPAGSDLEPVEGDMLADIESICMGCVKWLRNPPVYPCFVAEGRSRCHSYHISNRSCATLPDRFHKEGQALIDAFHEMQLSDVSHEKFASYQTAVAKFVLDVQVYEDAGGVLMSYADSDELLPSRGEAFDYSSVPESAFTQPANTLAPTSLGRSLGILIAEAIAAEDEEADGPSEVPEEAIEEAQAAINAAEDLVVSGTEASNLQSLEKSVLKAIKAFKAKVRLSQQDSTLEPGPAMKTESIPAPITTSPVSTLKSSMKRAASSVEEPQTIKRVRFADDDTPGNVRDVLVAPRSFPLRYNLDVGYFSPLKTSYGQQVENQMRLGINHIDKEEVLALYSVAHMQALNDNNIKSGFRAAGLVLYDPE
ncbi:hypothetical protein ACJ73_08367 [Blastomyces percursus]|uniref:Uncharacterized protein n=1 Tax=Blastomyces percursus TaxID=1658174 RepID=A0A1J9PWL8_9EURO|nr:hypothetical protein ACJ73_08367 [Blastomyces percursus]